MIAMPRSASTSVRSRNERLTARVSVADSLTRARMAAIRSASPRTSSQSPTGSCRTNSTGVRREAQTRPALRRCRPVSKHPFGHRMIQGSLANSMYGSGLPCSRSHGPCGARRRHGHDGGRQGHVRFHEGWCHGYAPPRRGAHSGATGKSHASGNRIVRPGALRGRASRSTPSRPCAFIREAAISSAACSGRTGAAIGTCQLASCVASHLTTDPAAGIQSRPATVKNRRSTRKWISMMKVESQTIAPT